MLRVESFAVELSPSVVLICLIESLEFPVVTVVAAQLIVTSSAAASVPVVLQIFDPTGNVWMSEVAGALLFKPTTFHVVCSIVRLLDARAGSAWTTTSRLASSTRQSAALAR
jgi:hypothetical protein